MHETILTEDYQIIENIKEWLPGFGKERSHLIPILQRIQERYAFLAPMAMELVADHLGISVSEVFGVATFYNQFRFHPPGKNPIKVCLGTACHVKGGEIILENFERKLDIKAGQTTPDREFSIDRVACVGCCALAPVAMVGEETLGHMAPSKVEGLLLRHQIQKQKDRKERDSQDA